jgi:hypothetical protein
MSMLRFTLESTIASHPGLEIDTVRPDVDVAACRRVAALLAVKVACQARDNRRRQVRRVLPEQRSRTRGRLGRQVAS